MQRGNVVLITGASRGFGAAAARLIAGRGNTVVATMRNPERDGGAVREGLADSVHLERLDVVDGDAVGAVVSRVRERFGRIDVLINNAGYGLFGPVEDASEAEVWQQLDTNVLGQWRLLQAVLPGMREHGTGKVVNVSSLAGRVPSPFLGLYAASKHAVEAMSESLRFEVARSGVQVTVLEPGMFSSDWQTRGLGIVEPMREGTSAYPVAKAALAAFQAQAATRPGSRSVAVAMADIVGLGQHLPLRWPVGTDAMQIIPLRNKSTDEEWRFLWRNGALGDFRRWLRDSAASGDGKREHDWASGNVVLITGASRGFGEAAAHECAERGNTVVATMRNPARDGARVREGFEESIHVLALDVTDASSIRRAVDETMARFGRIDVLVNNAGYGLYGPLEEFTEDEVRRQLDTNFVGQWRVLRAVLPQMRGQGYGKIVNVSSLSGVVASPLMAFYAASKHAVEGMSEALADEVGPFGIQVCILQPGMYQSDWQTTNLDVSQAVREGRSAYQQDVERMLAEFRRRAITRPGSDAVGAAIADIVQLQQPLPLRWPIGEDAVSLIRARLETPDDEWERRLSAAGWGLSSTSVVPS